MELTNNKPVNLESATTAAGLLRVNGNARDSLFLRNYNFKIFKCLYAKSNDYFF